MDVFIEDEPAECQFFIVEPKNPLCFYIFPNESYSNYVLLNLSTGVDDTQFLFDRIASLLLHF